MVGAERLQDNNLRNGRAAGRAVAVYDAWADGTDYPNRIRYTEVRAPEFLAYDHDDGKGGPEMFKAVVQLDAEGSNKRVTLRMTFATKEQREAMAKFGAIEGGNQTLSRLEDYLTNA